MKKYFFHTTSKVWVLVIIVPMGLLMGCTALGNLVSGQSIQRYPGISYPEQLMAVEIGVTTSEDILQRFGDPTDIQVSSDGNTHRESWAYAQIHPKINPAQYIPGFGMLALQKDKLRHSFSISFSADGIVEGVVLQEVQPLGDPGALKSVSESASVTQPYGSANPSIYHKR